VQQVTGTHDSPFNVYSYGGIIWHLMQYSTPFIFLFVVDAFRAMDPALEEGKPHVRRFDASDILENYARPDAARHHQCLILSLMRGVESFEFPVIFGTPGNIYMLTTEIYRSINSRGTPEYQYATALAFVAMALMFLLLLSRRGCCAGAAM